MKGAFHLYEYALPNRDSMYAVFRTSRSIRPHIGKVKVRGREVSLPLLWKTKRQYVTVVKNVASYSFDPLYFFSLDAAIEVHDIANGIYHAKRTRGWLEKKIDQLLAGK